MPETEQDPQLTQSMTSSLSVIICTRNPRKAVLVRVLDSLARQSLDSSFWELLIIDNASNPPLEIDKSGLSGIKCEIIREEEPGLTHARLCGIRHAAGNILVFVDDDNILDEHYLSEAVNIAEIHPVVGAWGGCNIPEFEVAPPSSITPQLGGLALGIVENPVFSDKLVFGEATPFGAGMCIQREVADYYLSMVETDPLRKSLGRCGKSLGAGEDTDMAFCAIDLGMRTARFPDLKLTHIIPKERLTVDYMEKIFEGFGFASVILPYIRDSEISHKAPSMLQLLRTRTRWLLAFAKNDSLGRIRARGYMGQLRAKKFLSQIMK